MSGSAVRIGDDPTVEREFVRRLRAFLGGGDEFVALHEPLFGGEETALLKDCIDTGWVSSVGRHVDAFEAVLAERCGAAHAVAVVNGTAGLHVALLLAGVRPGDEVLAPTLTFVATANAVVHAGAVPHFVDSAIDTLGVDPGALRAHLEEIADRGAGGTVNRRTGRRIAAILPMHTFGHPVDMDAITSLASDFDITVVEDATESLGSLYKGRPTGALGRLGVLSFNGNKIVTTGGGGAIVTNDRELAAAAKHLTTTAKTPHPWGFVHDRVGFNYRLPNLNAALGRAQMAQLDGFVAAKRRLAQGYAAAFADFEWGTIFQEPAFARSNYWLNAILLDEQVADRRDAVLEAANAAGLQCRPAWTLMHKLPMFANAPRMDLPVAESIERRLVNMPSSVKLAGVSRAP